MPLPDQEPAVERLVSSLLYQVPFSGEELIGHRLCLSGLLARLEAGYPANLEDIDYLADLYDRIGQQFDLPGYPRADHPAGTTFV